MTEHRVPEQMPPPSERSIERILSAYEAADQVASAVTSDDVDRAVERVRAILTTLALEPKTVAQAVRNLLEAIEHCDLHPDDARAADRLDVAWADVSRLDEELADLRNAAGPPAADE